ncbi:hypothetical protein TNCV_152231 [Trichonephila clavipes]|uniref:Uncharacterized protein n=1 Tax=Trichonephila clavipes TaxID=2585209 RepID=A0A8X6RQN2_TRICX|nr:hypothetical protein TNCV_152231 [Trichonephila clavipes]
MYHNAACKTRNCMERWQGAGPVPSFTTGLHLIATNFDCVVPSKAVKMVPKQTVLGTPYSLDDRWIPINGNSNLMK